VIQRMSHATVHVLDQSEALAFYRDKLGFEVRDDITMDGFRWLTVSPKGQPDLEIVLFPAPPDVKELVEKGVLGAGVLETDDIHSDYERLRKEGFEFASPPEEREYGGIDTGFKDNSGNFFSLRQREK
jgi:catechol 2,3-dioxygenase-like lactoylglutathione lyase family enzyme